MIKVQINDKDCTVIFTKHFWDALEKRKYGFSGLGINIDNNIEAFVIDNFLSNPDIIISDPKFENREWRIKKIHNKCIRVVIEVKNHCIISVITIFLDRGLKRKGLCD